MISKLLNKYTIAGTALLGLGALGYYLYSNKLKSSVLPPAKEPYLTEEMAKSRRLIIVDRPSYNLILKCKKGITYYEGYLQIDFKLASKSSVFLDFIGSNILSIKINNKALPGKEKAVRPFEWLWDGNYIHLPKAQLLEGENCVQIYFQNEYSKTGNGFHSFIDEDKKQYIYSNCEPESAHKWYPCFDQPDIKSYLRFTVITEENWVAVSNESLKRKERATKNQLSTIVPALPKEFTDGVSENDLIYIFSETLPLSTYLFCLCVGDYQEFQADELFNYIPMSFYCRKSLAKHAEKIVGQWFEIARKVLEFYENFFGRPFPFNKLDHVLCPEFNVGAMENPGIITFTDSYIPKEEVDLSKTSRWAMVISHEICHMWFGDLVTMKWWNDLWLNESFAEFMGFFALANVKLSFPINDMQIALNVEKGWGQRDDQLKTTHPIAGKVANTQEAETIFDGITQAKGAAVLKQLLFLLGREKFSAAMNTYFSTYQWKNTVLDDFIGCLEKEFAKCNYDFTLQEWKQSWICKAGLDEIEAIWDPTISQGLQKIIIRQSPVLPEHDEIRIHKLKLAFFKENGEADIKEIIIKKTKETEVQFDASNKYKAVLLNYDDEGFVKVLFDKQSIQFYEQNLQKIKQLLSRIMIYRVFYDMVRDGKISSLKYINLLGNNLTKEKESQIINDALNYAEMCVSSWTPIRCQKQQYHTLFEMVLKMYQENKEKEKTLLFVKLLIKFGKFKEDLEKVVEWFKGTHPILKFPLGITQKWSVVKNVFLSIDFSLQQKNELLSVMLKDDQSDEKAKMEKFCFAAQASKIEKDKLWKSFLDPDNKESNHLISASMAGFNNPEDENMAEYNDFYFDKLPIIFATRDLMYFNVFSGNLFPISDDFTNLINKVDALLDRTPQTQIALWKFLMEEREMLTKRMKAIETFLKDYASPVKSK